eukprot:m.311986 g.311986  ORF g.311986 m.311986 type:complete len:56 (+) comp19656_c0_seq2:2421-2588(+)
MRECNERGAGIVLVVDIEGCASVEEPPTKGGAMFGLNNTVIAKRKKIIILRRQTK